jgi:hypothetical protein
MKNRFQGAARAGAMLAFFVLAMGFSAHSRADDESTHAGGGVAPPAQQQLVRFPALKAGGVRSDNVMLITDSGTQSVRAAVFAQRQMSGPAPSAGFCIPR